MNKPQRDAKLLEDCMKGVGTNDVRLVARILRVHYDPDPRHMLFVKEVYQQRYGRTLVERVRKDTKGAYRDLLLKLVEGRPDLGTDAFF
jgi:annexin A7/11